MAALPAPDLGVARAEQLVLRAAVSAYLGRYRGETRLHTESDLRVFLRWSTDQGLDPLAAARVDIERYVSSGMPFKRLSSTTATSTEPKGCTDSWP
jgi:predicted transcriptional regulator